MSQWKMGMRGWTRVIVYGILLMVVVLVTPLKDLPFYLLVRPPASVVDLESFVAWRPRTEYVLTKQTDKRTYYYCFGGFGRCFASGPACYAFDDELRFVGWSSDVGDYQGTLPADVYRGELKLEGSESAERRRVVDLLRTR